MDHLVDLLSGELQAYMAMGADEGRQMDAAEKRPAAQGGDSKEEEMEIQSNRISQERLRFLAAEKRPAAQGGDSKEEEEMERQGPDVQERDADEVDAVMRSEVLRILMQSMGDQKKATLANLLKCEEEENQPRKQKQQTLQSLFQNMLPSDRNKMWGKLLKLAEENQPQQRKQNKKHNHRKSRMALRKIALDKAKKSSSVEKPPTEDKAAAYLAAWAKERESEPESESRSDWHAYQARLCRDRWNESFDARHYGTYETITSIPPMRFTDYVDASAGLRETLQIFSVRVVGVKEGVDWPLYVYGKLAVRDAVDHNRNIIFDRPRDNFQTFTEQDPYLTLTGPCRAAVLSVHHSYIEAELKIKGNSSDSSDDKDFSYLATGYIQTASCESFVIISL
ncbi:hypothetical protein ACQ4PT_031661 [Festuca glaucescens]